MAHETIPLAAIRTVAARTMYDPQAICGTKSKTSIKKARSERIKVNMLKMKIPSRNRGECEALCVCADPARTSITRVKKAATGWTMRIYESVDLTLMGRSKLALSMLLASLAACKVSR